MEKEKIENIAPDLMPEIKETEKKEVILTEEQVGELGHIKKIIREIEREIVGRRHDRDVVERLAKNIIGSIDRFLLPAQIIKPILEQVLINIVADGLGLPVLCERRLLFAQIIASVFGLPEELIKQVAARKVVIHMKEHGYGDLLTEIKFSLSHKDIQKEIVRFIYETLENILIKKGTDSIYDVKILLCLAKEDKDSSLIEGISKNKGIRDMIIKVINEYFINHDNISKDSFETLKELKDTFNVSIKEVEGVIGFIINNLSSSYNFNIETTFKIKQEFQVVLSHDIVYKYFQNLVHQNAWREIANAGVNIVESQSVYKDFINQQKNTANNVELFFLERQKAFDALAGLAENGESSITEEFSQILKSHSKQKEVPESKWGLDLSPISQTC